MITLQEPPSLANLEDTFLICLHVDTAILTRRIADTIPNKQAVKMELVLAVFQFLSMLPQNAIMRTMYGMKT